MFSANRKLGQLRRVVTGFNEKGVSIIQSDTILEPKSSGPDSTAASATVWTTDTFPTNVLDPIDGATRPIEGIGIRSPNGM